MNWKKACAIGGIILLLGSIPIYLMTTSGLEFLHTKVQDNRGSEFWIGMQYRIAKTFYNTSRWPEAEKHFIYYAENFQEGEDMDLCLFFLGLTQFELEKKFEAADTLELFLDSYPDHELAEDAEKNYRAWRH
jgi:TolA-binding protein